MKTKQKPPKESKEERALRQKKLEDAMAAIHFKITADLYALGFKDVHAEITVTDKCPGCGGERDLYTDWFPIGICCNEHCEVADAFDHDFDDDDQDDEDTQSERPPRKKKSAAA